MRLGRGVFVFDEDTHPLRLKSELFDLWVGYANPILRLEESQRGVRILSYRSQRNKKTTELFGLGCPFIWLRRWDLNLMTHRTSRIVVDCRSAPLRGSYALASPTPCFVVSTVVKTLINRFHLGRRLFALRLLCNLGLITSKVMKHRVTTVNKTKKQSTRDCFSFWLRRWDLNLMTFGL